MLKLNTRAIKSGNCLDHAKRLLELCYLLKGQPCKYKLAQGLVNMRGGTKGLHCWIECNDLLVIDLTTTHKYHTRDIYYEHYGVSDAQTYTAQEVGTLVATKGLTFWGRELEEVA